MIDEISLKFGINAEHKIQPDSEIGLAGGFPRFIHNVSRQLVCILCDENTKPYAEKTAQYLRENRIENYVVSVGISEPVADEVTVGFVERAAKPCDYILAVGAGTLNDLAKYAAFRSGKKSGIFATAASMDGFASGVTPLIENGFKITKNAQAAKDILIDSEVLSKAPKIMTGAGVGDILAKYCCLSDWKMSHILFGEEYNEESANLMKKAVDKCSESIPSLIQGEREGIDALMDALIISGISMVIAGSSRPASGAEHHMSHFLEMDYLKRGKKIPLHGVKVGLGTMVSSYLYHNVEKKGYSFEGAKVVAELAEDIPDCEHIRKILSALGCPTRFSQIGVSEETFEKMLLEAHKIRDRFTILTLYNRENLIDGVIDELKELFL